MAQKVRRTPKRKHSREYRKKLGQSIELRPKIVDDKEEFGHWEIDLIIGKKLPSKKAQCVNEAQNGLIRVFIPKGKPISQVSDRIIKRAEEWINKIPRKLFKYSSSVELFEEEILLIYAT